MPTEPPLLTIAIPTYNRAHYLDQLLATLLEETRGETRVELLVSDNASPDGTKPLVAAYQNRGAEIRYILNETNVGPDLNILQCYEQASGRYVWIFSDDDLMAPGTVRRVLDALSSEKYDLICIRSYSFEGDYKGHRRFTSAPDLALTRPEDLARHVHVFFTFISAVIVNKERNSSAPHRRFDSLVGTNLVQLGPFYTALNHHRRSLLIRDPLIAARGNSNVGYALYRVFGPTLVGITRDWIEKKATQRAVINGTIQKFLPFWILMSRKSQASSVHENPHKVLCSCVGSNLWYWIFDYPIFVLPLPLAKTWLLGVRVINKLDALRMRMQVSS